MSCLRLIIRNRLSLRAQVSAHHLLCVQRRLNNTDKQFDPKTLNGKSGLNLETIGANTRGDCLIYSGPQNMVKMIKMIKTFSISTTLLAAGVQPFIFQKLLATNTSAFAVGFAGLTSAGIVMSPLVLNWFTKRYVTQLYYNYETQVFTAWVLNLLNRRSSVQYKAEDVLVPEVLGVFTTFTVGPKKRPFFVDPEFVTDLTAYKQMLGYDRPLDLKLTKIVENSSESESKSKF